ncbi:hypothetical protein [Nonomuraea longicatena]|uniref:Minor tail protein n=1 Tax=Nonomuraea longicatena TaxID=83682 RepID=A0ABN1RAT4_9ACTN
MVFISEDFEDDTFVLDITGTWIRTNASAGSGSWSMRSAPIGHSQMTEMVVRVPAEATHMQSKMRLSTEGGGYDPLELYGITGEGQYLLLDGAWGILDWHTWANPVRVGAYAAIAFRYSRDHIDGGGEDTVWIDDLTFYNATPEPPEAVANNFDAGQHGAPITAENSGGLNGMAFTLTTGEPRYTGDRPRRPGGLALDCATADGQAEVRWTGPPGLTGTTIFARFYWRAVDNTGRRQTVFDMTSESAWVVDLWNDLPNSLRLDFAGTVGPSLTGIPADRWVRIEVGLTVTAGVGHVEAWAYHDPDSATADQHVVSSFTAVAEIPHRFRFYVVRDAGGHTLVDDIAVADTKLGPVGLPRTASMGAAVESGVAKVLPRVSRHSMALVPGTDTARTLQRGKQHVILSASSSESALALRSGRMHVIGAAGEDGRAGPLDAIKIATIAAVVNGEESRRLYGELSLGLARDESQTRPLTRVKARPLSAAIEHSSAKGVVLARGRTLARALSSEAGIALRWTKAGVIGATADRNAAAVLSPLLPPLAVGLPDRLWGVSAPELLRGGVVDPISSLSLEYVRVFVRHARGTEPVEMAFTTPGIEPGPADWKTASWAETKNLGAVAHILVGPNGAVTLADGTYQVWVRTTRREERPVLPSGLVPII